MQTLRLRASFGAILKALLTLAVTTASLLVNGTTTCAGSKFKFTLTRPEYFSSPDETWSLDGGQDITDPALNNCFSDCTTSIREVVFSTPGTYTVNVDFVDPTSGCSFSKSQQVVVVPLVNGICCSPIYDREIGNSSATTVLDAGGGTVVYDGLTKVNGFCELVNGTFLFPNGSEIHYIPMGLSPAPSNNPASPCLMAKNNGEIRLEGAKLKLACLGNVPISSAPEIAAIAASGTGRITAKKAAITNPLANRIEMPGAYFHLSGVSTPNLIENCVFVAKNSLFLGGDAAIGTLTLRGNTFSGSFETLWDPNPLYNVVNLSLFADAKVEDNSFLNGSTMGSGLGMGNLEVKNNTFDNPRGPAIFIHYIHDDVIIKCNAFKFDAANTFAGVGIKLTAKVNNANELGSTSSPVGNSWPNSANVDLTTIAQPSPEFAALTSPTNWTSIENGTLTPFKYARYPNEFVGTVSGITTPTFDIGQTGKATSSTCPNPEVKFALLRRGITTDLTSELSSREEIPLFPNPCFEVITCEFGNVKPKFLQITNAIGITVLVLDLEGNDKSIAINTSQFPTGLYYLRLGSPEQTIVQKFVKR
jgi:hypothetical protein